MRYVWLVENESLDVAKCKHHGIDGVYRDVRFATQAELIGWHAGGLSVGVYMADSWGEFKNLTGPQKAEKMHAYVQALKWGTSTSTPRVQFDLEEHAPEKIAACLERWRVLQPRRDTSWTMEPWQGGWMSPAFVQRILACRVRVVPQFYMGPSPEEPFDMRPAAGDMVVRDLTRRGFPENIVTGFYDAALVTPSSRWNGFAFTQGRLT